MQGWRGFSLEVLARRWQQLSARDWPWLLAAAAALALVALWTVLLPYELRELRERMVQAAQWLALGLAGFTLLYCAAHWLGEGRFASLDEEDRVLPLPPVQLYLHRLARLLAVPLLAAGTGVIMLAFIAVYIGVPFNPGLTIFTGDPAGMWYYRVGLMGLNLPGAVLLTGLLAALLDLAVPWRALRIILLVAVPVGLYFLLEKARWEFTEMSYRQTRGYDLWLYVAVLGLLLLLPFLLAWLRPRWRFGLLVLLLVAAGALASLVYLQYSALGINATTRLRDALGDLRYVLAYYAGHLHFWRNIDYLDWWFMGNVLLKGGSEEGGMIPRHIPLWVGAGLFPPLYPLLALCLMVLGVSLRPGKRDPAD